MKPVFFALCLMMTALPAFAQIPAPVQPGSVTTTTTQTMVQEAPTNAPTPPVAPQATVTAPVAPVVQAPATPVVAQPPAAKPLIAMSLADQFKGQLPFTLTEEKMVAFTEASRRIKKINQKWDVQIAGADTDKRAKEYNDFALEEITKSMQKVQGLTLDEYTALTKLTATNADFSRVYMAYKELLEQGKIKAKIAETPTEAPIKSDIKPKETKPQANSAATPQGSGTAPKPQGSPAPQYSPQPSQK